MASNAVAMTLFRRPGETREALEALSQCYGVEDWSIYLSLDYSQKYHAAIQRTQDEIWDFLKGTELNVNFIVRAEPLGIDVHKLVLFQEIFQKHDYCVLLEDDTPIAQDGLRFFAAMDKRFRTDKSVTSISGYNRYCEAETHARVLATEPYALDRGEQFTPWGFGIWGDRYELINGYDGNKYRDATGENANGLFDHNMCRWMKENSGHYTVYPVLPRTNHTGGTNAEHTPNPEWLMANEFSPYGAWSQAMPDPGPDKEWVAKW